MPRRDLLGAKAHGVARKALNLIRRCTARRGWACGRPGTRAGRTPNTRSLYWPPNCWRTSISMPSTSAARQRPGSPDATSQSSSSSGFPVLHENADDLACPCCLSRWAVTAESTRRRGRRRNAGFFQPSGGIVRRAPSPASGAGSFSARQPAVASGPLGRSVAARRVRRWTVGPAGAVFRRMASRACGLATARGGPRARQRRVPGGAAPAVRSPVG